jgi:hypothetical protein
MRQGRLELRVNNLDCVAEDGHRDRVLAVPLDARGDRQRLVG